MKSEKGCFCRLFHSQPSVFFLFFVFLFWKCRNRISGTSYLNVLQKVNKFGKVTEQGIFFIFHSLSENQGKASFFAVPVFFPCLKDLF